MAGTLTPAWFLYFTDSEGAPLVGGKVYTFLTGTSTPTPVYQDADLLVPFTNPIIIPADGRVTIYQDANTIKAVWYTAADVLVDSVDPIKSSALNASIGGTAFTFGGDDDYPITNTSLPSGTAVSAIHPGTSHFQLDSAQLIGTYALQGMLQAGAGEIVTASLVNLFEGAPDTPMVSITSLSTAGQLSTSSAITWSAGGVARTYAIKTKVGTGTSSFGWGFAIVRTS